MIGMVTCLKALADENRLRVLMLLRERELCGCELMGLLGLSQPLVSSHMAVLRGAGLVEERKEGRRKRYSLTPKGRSGGKAGILRIVAEALEEEPVMAADRQRLRQCVDARRAEGSCTRGAARRCSPRGGAR
jgi:DNA-binding transcriptional ArsR family regulator